LIVDDNKSDFKPEHDYGSEVEYLELKYYKKNREKLKTQGHTGRFDFHLSQIYNSHSRFGFLYKEIFVIYFRIKVIERLIKIILRTH
jgi:hypothetical protein